MTGLGKIATTSALLCVSAFSFGQIKNRIIQPIDKSQMVRLRGNVHPLTRVGTDLGRLNGATQLKNVTLIFNQSASQKAALQALIQQQRDPSSPNYHKWLTPAEYGARFGMSQDDLNKVADWLKSQGFAVNSISNSRTRLAFSGTVAQVESAFQTEFHRYKVDGEMHLANATDPSVPAALSGSVVGFWKMDDFRWKPRAVVKAVAPRFTFGTRTALAPGDIATIYNLTPLYNAGIDGTGQRIAVVGQTSISLSDINSFRSNAGLPVNPPVVFLLPGGTPTLNQSDEVEADLDLEWSGAIAKNATIVYIYANQNQQQGGAIGAFEYAIDNNIAPVVSISYGACEAANGQGFITFLEGLMSEADTNGQTISSSIGDSGATDCEPANSTIATTGLAVDVPGAIPDFTAVGGTRFTTDDNANPTFWNSSNDPSTGASAIQYIPETTWNDGFGSSTGGGVSSLIAKPAFQTALTPADGHRDVPDVALSASPEHDPYLVCDANKTTQSCASGFIGNALLVGGTSAGAPVFAGMIALINQATENSAGQASINPTLYGLAGDPTTYAKAFHDITTGDNKQTCKGGSTGCTTANSHVVAEERHSGLPVSAVLLLIPLGAVVVSAGRRRAAAVLSMLLVAAAFSVQIACGGGSNNNNNNSGDGGTTPPPNLSIGWSAGTGYDLVTGLGSVNLDNLAQAWPGFTSSPAFKLDQTQTTQATSTVPGVFTITLTRTDSSFTGNVQLSCVETGDATGDPQASCTLNPTTRTLNSGTPATSTLTVTASHPGIYSVLVKGQSGAISHAVNVPVTVN